MLSPGYFDRCIQWTLITHAVSTAHLQLNSYFYVNQGNFAAIRRTLRLCCAHPVSAGEPRGLRGKYARCKMPGGASYRRTTPFLMAKLVF
jgi:hypothetical protein